MSHVAMRLLAGAVALALFESCTFVRITSEPPDAEIRYSTTGTAPWQSWPPKASKARATPARKITLAEPCYFVRVQKEGYYPARPSLVDVRWFHRQSVHFQLEPTPELFAQQQREKGLVLYKDRWVSPQQESLVEYEGKWMKPEERLAREQKAKGLVFYKPENRWVTSEESEQLEARQMLQKGFLLLKGRWVSPQEADLERLIDRQASRLAISPAAFEIRIERIGPTFTSNTQLRVADLTGHPLEVLLSGPQSRRARVPTYNSVTIESEPGTYTLVVQEADQATSRVGVARVRLAPRNRYSATYRGAPLTKRPRFMSPPSPRGPTKPSAALDAPAAPSLKKEHPPDTEKKP